MAGFIGQLENLKRDSQPANPWAIAVQGENGLIVPTVIARLDMDEPRYYLWVELHPDRPFGDDADPALILYAFDPYIAADEHSSVPMVAVWSVSETTPQPAVRWRPISHNRALYVHTAEL